MKAVTLYMQARLWSQVDVRTPGECWLYRGALNSNGYGAFKVDGRVCHMAGCCDPIPARGRRGIWEWT